MLRGFIALVLLALCSCGAGSDPGDRGVSDLIASRVASGSGTILDMTEVAGFEWTRFCAFPPYTPEGATEEALGFEWPRGLEPAQARDDVADLVFVDGDRIVARFTHPRDRGDFAHLHERDFCSDRGGAVFTVEERGVRSDGTPHLVVVPS